MNIQLHISKSASPEDTASVARIFAATAEQFGMVNTTVTSRVQDTICCHSESFKGGFSIGARIVGEIVIADLGPGRPPSPRFPTVAAHITQELFRVFGERLTTAKESEFIKWQNTLPVSEAAHEFYRKRGAEIFNHLK